MDAFIATFELTFYHYLNQSQIYQLISPWTKWPLKRILLNENIWITNKILLKYILPGLIDNMSALVQIVAWRRLGDKPLSEPMLAQFIDAYMRH